MVYTPPKYPAAIPDLTDLPDRVDGVDWAYAARVNELKKELRAIMIELGTLPKGASADVKTRLALLATKANVLELDNATPFTPDQDYEPATKKYVDDATVVGYTDRGDPADYDFVLGDLTEDSAFHDMNLAGIVPAGAKAVLLLVLYQASAVDSDAMFKKKGVAQTYALARIRTQVANIYIMGDLVVACDTNRVIEYSLTSPQTTAISITVKGWWM